ncbi:MAG: hypothetical protein ACQEXQ_28665 [Bacillota bacterium]
MRIKMMLMVILLLFTACGSKSYEENQVSEGKETPKQVLLEAKNNVKDCPDAEIDYIDALMWNDISYDYVGDETFSKEALKVGKGKEVGEIDYTLSDNACMDYKMKNGDATFLLEGTKVYEVEGYKSTFRLIAGEKLYQSNGNPNAKIVSDVYDIQGKVSKISFESTNDGHQISVFTEEAEKEFIEEYLALEYVGFDEIYKRGKGLGDKGKEFLRIHLDDDTSFRISYWTEENLISPGAVGTDRLKTITLEQGSTD